MLPQQRTTPTSIHNISYEFSPCYNLCQNNVTVIPVLNIPRGDFPLRTEVTFILNEYELSQVRNRKENLVVLIGWVQVLGGVKLCYASMRV